ncbi:thiol-disulfide oxidoreductase DCC family protein [Brevundimonas sp. VNH65]|uniref:thiol-disulfide oxidoreductase DCC family protein n=1 Tax=Brevundimonas sp. VNH65 TaxID=3400917 RepID=UPI003BFD11C3
MPLDVERETVAGEPDGLILFDGVCVFCSAWVRFILKHDRAGRFVFLPIQTERGRALAERLGIDADRPRTNAVLMDGQAWVRSDAALKVLEALPSTRVLGVLRAVPRILRDPVYDLIAANRYRLFGHTTTCMAPSPGDRARFLL